MADPGCPIATCPVGTATSTMADPLVSEAGPRADTGFSGTLPSRSSSHPMLWLAELGAGLVALVLGAILWPLLADPRGRHRG